MPLFTFRAMDRLGNTVDGSIEAVDHSSAIEQIMALGYSPIGVQLAGVVLPTQQPAAPQPSPANATRRGPVDLTQPVTEMPVAAVDLYATSSSLPEPTQQFTPPSLPQQPTVAVSPQGVGGPNGASSVDNMTARMERLEPWERTIPLSSEVNPITVAMAPQPMRHRNEIARGLENIPFGANSLRSVPMSQRAKEVLLYPIISGVKLKDLAQWYRQLGTLIGAGLNFNQSLVALADNTKNERLKAISEDGVRQVRAGGYLSDVMAAYPWVFPPMHLEMLRAAEHGGLMEDTLRQIGDYVEHEMAVRQLISRETLYPKIVLFVLVMLMGRSGIFGGMPAIAALVLGGSVRAYFADTVLFALAILIPIAVFAAFCRLSLFNSRGVRNMYDAVKIRLPVLGKIIRNYAIGKFARTYAALAKAGFPTSSALQIAADASGNVVIARAGQSAALRAENGFLPSQALAESGQFTSVSIDMLRTAETSGSVDEMMYKVTDYHEQEAKAATHTVAMIFSVTVFLIVALIVGSAVIGQYQGMAGAMSRAAND